MWAMKKDTKYYGFIMKGGINHKSGINKDLSKKVALDMNLKESTSFVNSEVWYKANYNTRAKNY